MNSISELSKSSYHSPNSVKSFDGIIYDAAQEKPTTIFDPLCIRKKSNWTVVRNEHKMDDSSFNPELFLKDVPNSSPKLNALLKKIDALDKRDQRKYGKQFKHFIFSDIKSGGQGAKMLAAGLIATGWTLGYRAELKNRDRISRTDERIKASWGALELLPNRDIDKGFYLLSSVSVFDKPISVRMKKEILSRFNARPDNIYGEHARIIIMDSGFKEGIDLFDIKYVHIFEPALNAADQKQVIGRGTRTCGQKGLEFHPIKGWPLEVFLYDLEIPDALRGSLLGSQTAQELLMKAMNADIRLANFGYDIERLSVIGSVDYELNEMVHSFAVDLEGEEDDEVVFGGALAKGALAKGALVKGAIAGGAIARGTIMGGAIAGGTIVGGEIAGEALAGGARRKFGEKKGDNLYRNRTKLDHEEMVTYIRENYGQYRWPDVKMENLCEEKVVTGGAKVGEMNMGGAATILNYTPTQAFISHYFKPSAPIKGMLLHHSVGTGKCHAKDTPILMHNGSIKMVQDIQVGEFLMGDNSEKRQVLSLATGEDDMYDIIYKGGKYTVNSEHILCLKASKTLSKSKELQPYICKDGIIEIEVKEYLKLPDNIKRKLKGYRSPVEFETKSIEMDPYLIGKNKIPFEYKTNNSEIRLQVLAGILDTCGYIKGKSYKIKEKIGEIADDILFLCRSLGFNVYKTKNIITIQGEGKIPLRVLQEVNKKSRGLSIDVKPVGRDNYYGFTLDGNNRYLLGDFIVTHNTCSAIAAATANFEPNGYTILWVTRTTLKNDIWKNMFAQVCNENIRNRIASGEIIPDEQKEQMKLLSKAWRIRPISYKQFSNLVSKQNSYYHRLVKENGEADPLRKTLLIIDEAHKLYGGGDLSSLERPDMPALQRALMTSYAVSGEDSVRLLLMTATPITVNPMELVQLVNLCKPVDQQIPATFELFSENYLNDDGTFTQRGSKKFLDDIAGHISYLNREKDARQFAQPIIKRVLVPIATESQMKDIRDFDKYIARTETESNILELQKNIEENTGRIEGELAEIDKTRFQELKDICDHYEEIPKKKCNTIINKNITALVKEAKQYVKSIKDEIKGIKTAVSTAKKGRIQLLKNIQAKIIASPHLFAKYKASTYAALRTCSSRSTAVFADAVKDIPEVAELNRQIQVINEEIEALNTREKIEISAFKLKIKQMKELLKDRDLAPLERSVLEMTIQSAQKEFRRTVKHRGSQIKETIDELQKDIKLIENEKKKVFSNIRKTIKSRLNEKKKEKRAELKDERDLRKTLRKQGLINGKIQDQEIRDMVDRREVLIVRELEDISEEEHQKEIEKMRKKREKDEMQKAKRDEKQREKQEEKERKVLEKQREKERKAIEKREEKQKAKQEEKTRKARAKAEAKANQKKTKKSQK